MSDADEPRITTFEDEAQTALDAARKRQAEEPLRRYCVTMTDGTAETVTAHRMQDPYISFFSLTNSPWISFVVYRLNGRDDIVAKFREANVKSVRIVDEEPI